VKFCVESEDVVPHDRLLTPKQSFGKEKCRVRPYIAKILEDADSGGDTTFKMVGVCAALILDVVVVDKAV
jgi:hypothetical protein